MLGTRDYDLIMSDSGMPAPQLEKPFTVESVKRVVRRALLAE